MRLSRILLVIFALAGQHHEASAQGKFLLTIDNIMRDMVQLVSRANYLS